MISGTFVVETSDDTRFSVGVSYPLSIDDSAVELSVVESVSVGAIPAAPAVEPELPAGDSAPS